MVAGKYCLVTLRQLSIHGNAGTRFLWQDVLLDVKQLRLGRSRWNVRRSPYRWNQGGFTRDGSNIPSQTVRNMQTESLISWQHDNSIWHDMLLFQTPHPIPTCQRNLQSMALLPRRQHSERFQNTLEWHRDMISVPSTSQLWPSGISARSWDGTGCEFVPGSIRYISYSMFIEPTLMKWNEVKNLLFNKQNFLQKICRRIRFRTGVG